MSVDLSPVLPQREKSTNVRDGNAPEARAARPARPLPLGLRALRTGLQLLDGGSPELAARVGEHLMFRTRRYPEPGSERRLLGSMERFDLITPRGRVAAWRVGQGPVVLLVHGWNGRGGQLGALVEPLLERGHQVVMFDAPGHGRSPGSESSLLHFADAIDVLIEQLLLAGGPLAGLVAHSMGGAAATYALHRRLARGSDPAAEVARVAMVAPPIDVSDFIRGFVRLAGLSVQAHLALRRRVERRFSLPLGALRVPPLAAQLRAPLLVVHDEQDAEVPLACGQALAEAWPGSRLQVTRGLGHTRILRQPEVVAALADHVAPLLVSAASATDQGPNR
jgi:pimeloyl-ACP methyl ester carboxylesterase